MSSKKKQSDLKAALQNFGKAVARFRNDDDQEMHTSVRSNGTGIDTEALVAVEAAVSCDIEMVYAQLRIFLKSIGDIAAAFFIIAVDLEKLLLGADASEFNKDLNSPSSEHALRMMDYISSFSAELDGKELFLIDLLTSARIPKPDEWRKLSYVDDYLISEFINLNKLA